LLLTNRGLKARDFPAQDNALGTVTTTRVWLQRQPVGLKARDFPAQGNALDLVTTKILCGLKACDFHTQGNALGMGYNANPVRAEGPRQRLEIADYLCAKRVRRTFGGPSVRMNRSTEPSQPAHPAPAPQSSSRYAPAHPAFQPVAHSSPFASGDRHPATASANPPAAKPA